MTSSSTDAAGPAGQRPRIALQMYTLREEAKTDFAGTLRAVAGLGYEGVELAGYGGMAPVDLRALLDELGLAAAGSHVALARLEQVLDEEIAFAAAIGCRDVVCPFLPEERRTLDGYRRVAEVLTRAGEACRRAGLRLSYHNHAFEFERFPSRPDGADSAFALDLLLGWTSPELVFWEPDVYWIARAGQDPVGYVAAYAGRHPLVHLKDVANDAQRSFAEVGAGTLDFGPLFTTAEAGGVEWYVVEQDRCAGRPIDSARLSLENLRAWGKG